MPAIKRMFNESDFRFTPDALADLQAAERAIAYHFTALVNMCYSPRDISNALVSKVKECECDAIIA